MKKEEQSKVSALAEQVLALAKDSLLVHLRFLDVAVSQLLCVPRQGISGVATDMVSFFYDPVFLLKQYRQEPHFCARAYLHALLHCIFSHGFRYEKKEASLWDLSADLAVEHTILEMDLPFAGLSTDAQARHVLQELSGQGNGLTAERIYRYFLSHPPKEEEKKRLRTLFFRDSHDLWKQKRQQELTVTEEMWKKISRRVQADLKSFSKGQTEAESLMQNLSEAVRDRCDYTKLLRRFTVMGEDLSVNEEEFDYIYYTYGLSHYGNLPLIEPLEYRDVKKIKEFVIALDTSASCKGPLLRRFLRRTYSILKSTEHFFQKINVHILQCDSQVRMDTRIGCQEDLEDFLRREKLQGFGSTDFRPVFSYVERLQESGEFENLKGLLYFTDGYGVYPERMPDYDVLFLFPEEDDKRPRVPSWAIGAVLEEEELEEENAV